MLGPEIGDDPTKHAAGDSAFIFCIIGMTVAVGATLFRRIAVPWPLWFVEECEP